MSQTGQYTYNGVTEVKTLTGDNGLHVPATLGNINILGSPNISVLGTLATSTLNIYIANTVQHAVQIGNISGGISSIPIATNGQVLLGSTNADPAFNNISVGNGIAKTEGPASLTIQGIQATTTQIGVVTLASDAEAIAGTDASKVIVPTSLKAKLGVQTLHGIPIGTSTTATIAWTAEPTNGQLLLGSTGNAPVLGNLSVSNGIAKTEGAGTLAIAGIQATTTQIGVVTLATDAESIAGADSSKVIVPTSLKAKLGTQTLHGLPIGASTTASITWTAEPTNGQLLIGNSGNPPSLSTLTAGNNIGIANAAGSITLKVAGTTQYAVQVGSATNDLTSLALGSSGQVLISAGAGANPAFSSPGTNSGLTQYGVVIAEGAGAFQATAAGTTGQTLMATTAANPSWTGSPSFSGTVTAGTGITSTTGNISASAGSLSASTTVTAGTNLVATAGNVVLPATSATVGQITIGGVIYDHAYGTNNVFIGNAGNFTLTVGSAQSNVGIGYQALHAVTTGANSVAIGYQAATVATTTGGLTALGSGSAASANVGITAVGYNALTSCTGDGSTAVGYSAAGSTTSAVHTTAMGHNSLYANVTSSDNTSIGYQAAKNVLGAGNVALGSSALQGATGAGTTAASNVGIGYQALIAVTSSAGSVAVGYQAASSITTATGSVAIGYGAYNAATDTGGTAVGYNALTASTGLGNTAVGLYAAKSVTSATHVTAIGHETLYTMSSTGGDNTAMGYLAAYSTTGGSNVAIGSQALQYVGNAGNNVALGYQALMGAAGGSTAGANICLGTSSMTTATTASYCQSVGFQALNSITSGSYNCGVGNYALQAITTGGYNIGIGTISSTAGGGSSLSGADTSNIDIGNVGTSGDTHIIRIGTDGSGNAQQNACFIAGINASCGGATALCLNTTVAGGGYRIGLSSSSRKLKENIVDMGNDSEAVYKLRPVAFNFKSSPFKEKQYGLIAEEVSEVMPEMVINDDNDEPMSVRYEQLSSLLLNEIKKLRKRIELLESLRYEQKE